MNFIATAQSFFYDIIFILEPYSKKTKKWLKENVASKERIKMIHLELKNEEETFAGRLYIFKDGTLVVYCPNFDFSHVEFGILSHEIFHVAGEILRRKNIPHVEETEEVYAYVLEDISRQAFKHIFTEWNSRTEE